MMVEAPGASVTVVVLLLSDGMISGLPLSAVKVTGNDTVPDPTLVKYTAEYHPPPNANWERIAFAVAPSSASWAICCGVNVVLKTATPAIFPSNGLDPSGAFPITKGAELVSDPLPVLGMVAVAATAPSKYRCNPLAWPVPSEL